MTKKRSPEEARRLKRLGLFDAGRTYGKVGGLSKVPKYVPWDEEPVQDTSSVLGQTESSIPLTEFRLPGFSKTGTF